MNDGSILQQVTRVSQPFSRFVNSPGGVCSSLWTLQPHCDFQIPSSINQHIIVKTVSTPQPQFGSANKPGKSNDFITFNEKISGYFQLQIMDSMTPFAGLISKEQTYLPCVFIVINLSHKFPNQTTPNFQGFKTLLSDE